jgi:hypothetical protein
MLSPVRTLDAVWEEHLGDRTVEFLKIDVEGAEHDVLLGAANTLRSHRALVIIVEAIEPGRSVGTHTQFENLLLQVGYLFAWFDGVNRWYLAPALAHLADRLAVPVHCFDHVITRGHEVALSEAERLAQAADRLKASLVECSRSLASATDELARIQLTVAALEDQQRSLGQQAQGHEVAMTALRAELDAVYASRSWRITATARSVLDRVSQAQRSRR